MKCTAFISDLHLSANHVENFAGWQDFLQKQLPKYQVEKLYILGDFFASWCGDDDSSAFNLQVIDTLKAVVDRGIIVYLLPGNRDFMLGEKFAKMSGCRLISDPTKIDLYGMSTVLTHGDILCTKDKVMNVFRFITRSNWCKKTFLFLPLSWRRKIAELVYNISQQARKGEGKPAEILAVDEMAVQKLLLQYQAMRIIHGHVHHAEILTGLYHSSVYGICEVKRCVLGEWIAGIGSVLLCYDNGKCKLKVINY